MTMDWGMANRMSSLIPADGRCCFLPIDHGYFQGPTRNLERPGDTIAPIVEFADALNLTRGVLRSAIDPTIDKPIILRVSGGTSMVGGDLSNEGITTTIEEAVRLNAAAVGLSVFIGAEHEHQSIMNLARLVNEAEPHGIPVMAVTAVGRELEKREARYLALASRICAEMGARLVKTYWCEEDFDRVVRGCPVPVVMAGGPQTNSQREVFDFVHDGLQRGAIGVNLGRNIWQDDHPVAMSRAIRSVVHDDATPAEAQELYESLSGTKRPAATASA